MSSSDYDENVIGESSSIKDDTSQTSLETPRVLTRNLISMLTHDLDAGDMLECYTLIRSAPLHGIANSTVTVQKMVMGIRFRPKGGQGELASALYAKKPMELTLEYGPQRIGALLNDEAMPIVQEEESTSYLSWDNVGRVYYTRKIVKENYLSSYYMASMTGAVFDKILNEAVDYAESRRRYQPFAVYSEERGRELRSSSSSDFTSFIWSHLAKLGVEIEPILSPPIYEARLWASSITKVVPEPAVANRAASFYQQLYGCLEAIATNNYANYELTAQPTSQPARQDFDSSNTSGHNDNDRQRGLEQIVEEGTENIYLKNETGHEEEEKHKEQQEETIPSSQNSTERTSTPTPSISPLTPSPTNQPTSLQSTPMPTTVLTEEPTIAMDEDGEDEDEEAPTSNKIPAEPGKDVEKAKQAAEDAQKAADEAKNAAQTEGENKAADAAQAAADAAHAAAAATSNAASQAAMDSLLSRDGSMMSSIATTCFTDPKYGIASVDENGTLTVEAYLYRDSSYYYKMNLTSPYIAVAKINRPLPKASLVSDIGSGGDPLDWLLALSLCVTVLFMILLICQQMGNHYIVSIVRCQRWFFNPRKYDYEGDTISGVQSGPLFYFGESGIPPSMGGRKSLYLPAEQQETLEQVLAEDHSSSSTDDDYLHSSPFASGNERKMVELEMRSLTPKNKQRRTPQRHERLEMNTRINSSSASLGSNEDADVALENSLPVPERFFRDPDLVDLPSLKSKSKIAVPVGSSNCSDSLGGRRSRSSSIGDDLS
jgi:hypothetical protein